MEFKLLARVHARIFKFLEFRTASPDTPTSDTANETYSAFVSQETLESQSESKAGKALLYCLCNEGIRIVSLPMVQGPPVAFAGR